MLNTKKNKSFASIIGLGYNTFLSYPRPITLAKRYLRFYRCHGPYMFHKTGKVFLYLIFAVFLYHFNCVGVSFYFLVHCTYSSFSIFYGGRLPSWIFIFSRHLQKLKFAPISTWTCKIWWRSGDQWLSYCVFLIFKKGDRPPSWILILVQYLKKIKFEPISTSTYKIWWRSDDPRPSYCVFLILQMAAIRHLGMTS